MIDSQYGRAIRSQPVEPKDEPATESARDSPQPRPNLSRRRPGSQSVHARPTKTDEPSGLTPRPSSVTGWVVEHGFPGWDDFDDIGRAITKDLSGLKRRSQSLSALATTSETLDGDPRRFSGEIRYWRDSYETQGKSSIATSHPGVEDQEDDHEKNEPIENPSAQAPVEPFKFPDVSDMSELSGMKITDVANLQHRIRSLESKTESLERTVENLSNFVLELDPFRNPSVSSSKSKGPATNKGGGEGPSSGNPRIHRGFQGQITGMSSSNSGDNGVLDTQPAMDAQTRPLSSVTIRGATSLPSLSNDTPRPLTMDQYTTLMALIDTERSSRVALEDKIKSLSHQINVMSKSAEKALGPKGYGFSKPSVGSAFDYDEEEDEDVTSTQSRRLEKRSSRSPWKGKERMVSRKSRTAITPDDKGHDDDSSPTPYATTHSDETDTDVLLPGKKKGRTLSLSKMTSKVS